MGNQSEKESQKEFIESLVKDQPVTRAFQKLNRGPFKVSVYRHTSLVSALETALAILEEALSKTDSEETKKQLQEKLDSNKNELAKLETDKIDGVLTHLTYRDINDVKAAVTEAVLHFKEYNFDTEVVMSRVVAEERFMTVFCALKQPHNLNARYFSSLDDIAQLDDATVFDLYSLWERHFVLTEDEIKN